MSKENVYSLIGKMNVAIHSGDFGTLFYLLDDHWDYPRLRKEAVKYFKTKGIPEEVVIKQNLRRLIMDICNGVSYDQRIAYQEASRMQVHSISRTMPSNQGSSCRKGSCQRPSQSRQAPDPNRLRAQSREDMEELRGIAQQFMAAVMHPRFQGKDEDEPPF